MVCLWVILVTLPIDCSLGNQPDGNQRERTEDDAKASVSSFSTGEHGNTCN